MRFKNALVSCSDKSGLVEFLKPLVEDGLRVVSTGGTAKTLKDAGIPVVEVSEQTGFPEVMGGRVKTLHPKVHMALLARPNHAEDQSVLSSYEIHEFDLVIGNLYPFKEALKKSLEPPEQIEFIDIGGPSFLRAAAKNFERITVICDPEDYKELLSKNELSVKDRKNLAAKVFSHTSAYDSVISSYLLNESWGKQWSLAGDLVNQLRYGENPQQKASWYKLSDGHSGLHDAVKIQGKELSYNNILDLQAAVSALRSFNSMGAVSVAVKHNNPCGVGCSKSREEAVEKSLKADPVSVFGGIVALNQPVNGAMAKMLTSLFLECIVAPSFDPDAKQLFKLKKNLRVLEWSGITGGIKNSTVKTVDGGFVVQSQDCVDVWDDSWKVIGPEVNNDDKSLFEFSWKVAAHLKSNSIAICSKDQSLGLGMGQVNRVDAVDQAIQRWKTHHGAVTHVALASDAFFPFSDSLELAHRAGIKKVIQPGGSIKDGDVVKKAEELGVQMVLTGKRHFFH